MFNNPYLMIDNLSLNTLMKRSELIKSAYSEMEELIKQGSEDIEKSFNFAPVLQKEGSRAMISINGPISFEASIVDKLMFGATSTSEIMAAVSDVARDNKIESVVFKVNSPGGDSHKMHVLADMVHSLSMQKSTASVNMGINASAAYFVSSQTSHMFDDDKMNKTGSIGCVALIHDYSEAAKMSGIGITVVSTGPLKGAGAHGSKINAEMISMVQEDVNKLQEGFSNAVQRGRPDSNMEDGAEARSGATFFYEKAQELGLVDGIKSIEETFMFLEQGNSFSRLKQSI